MTQEEFQQVVIEKLNKVEASVSDLQRFAVEQTEFNNDQREFNAKQLETNKELKISHDGLVKLIEQEVIDRLDVRNEKAMQYTDFMIQDHEQRYRHQPA